MRLLPAAASVADIGDPEGTRTVMSIVALLVVMGIGLVMLAVWLRRSTRPDPEFLAPLELMGERRWRRGDSVWQRRRLDEVRPVAAEPLRRPVQPPRLDAAFDDGPSGLGFDDLREEPDGRYDLSGEGADGDARDDLDDRDGRPGLYDTGDVPAIDVGERDEPLAHTPIATHRPLVDDLPDDEVDEEALRRAMEELDAELERKSEPS